MAITKGGARAFAGTSALLLAAAAHAGPQRDPWADRSLPSDVRAAALVRAMTLDEKIQLVHSSMPMMMRSRPADAVIGAGYTADIPRLGIPSIRSTDASLGVSNLMNMRKDDVATALPSALALAASFDPDLAFRAGAMIGSEARAKRFNVMLAGGVNLVREPRNGRAFEYLGEDPLLAGTLAGEQIRGIQSNGIVSTIKHFALNDQEIGRNVLTVRIAEDAARESDLLAFQIAIERGQPGSVMTAYNRVNGDYASENRWLLTDVLKRDWGFKGWVMSDWGNVHSTAKAATAGLDQQSGAELDKARFFDAPLKAAVEAGEVPSERLDDMARRILRSLIEHGVYDRPDTTTAIDFPHNAEIAQRVAESGIVLLKNDGAVLPLAASVQSIAAIGGHADIGVLSGGGSTQVRPVGGPALELRPPAGSPAASFTRITYTPSSPLAALQARFPQAAIRFLDGTDPDAAAQAARQADLAIVFAEQWRTEADDVPTLTLPGAQDALIEAVAGANRNVIVVLETGGAVLMPWLDRVKAVLQAWYPGQRGGAAIAAVLAGDVAPSGRLPISFPAGTDQLARPKLDGLGAAPSSAKVTYGLSQLEPFDVDYTIDGAEVGYRWFASRALKPLFPFGYGLTYTQFRFDGFTARGGRGVSASVRVTNIGDRAAIAVPQFYATLPVRGRMTTRLIGWQRIALAPGESRTVRISADRRLLAAYDSAQPGWRIASGAVRIVVGEHAGDVRAATDVRLQGGTLQP